MVLTGYPGTAEALFKKLRYPEIAAGEVAAGQAQPMILVMMRPTVAPPRDTECTDVPGGPQTETFFAKDLRTALAARYRVGTGRDGLGRHRRLDGRLLRAEARPARPWRVRGGGGSVGGLRRARRTRRPATCTAAVPPAAPPTT